MWARTVKNILHGPLARDLPAEGMRFCRSRGCTVLYYGPGGWMVPHAEARMPVGYKTDDGNALACYCFDVTLDDVRAAPRAADDIVAKITREIEAGNCACETRNPSGSCCLGFVRARSGDRS